MAVTRTELVHREVIESKLLARLGEEGTVAILLNKKDLDVLIDALKSKATRCLGEKHGKVCLDFARDLEKLRKGAFGRKRK